MGWRGGPRLPHRGLPMRTTASNAPLGLALLACAQLTLLSSTPAFADNASNGPSSMPAPTSPNQARTIPENPRTRRTGWIVLGVGGAITVAGIVLDVVGATQGTVAGAGGVGDSGNTSNMRTNFIWGGTTLIVAGIVTSVVGGGMIVNSRGSTRAADDLVGADGATNAVQAAYQRAPVFTVPVLGATF
jgi:hypothetical protein